MSKEDLLANCIDEIESGRRTVEECLASYPDLRDELRPLIEIAQCLQQENVAPSPEFKARARARLLEEMRQPEPALPPRRSLPGWLRPPSLLLKPALAIALVIAGLSAAGSTTIYASQGSLPHDYLYPVKRGVENLRLALTPDPADKALLNSTLAQRRVEEAVAQAKTGRDVSAAALQSAASNIDAAVREISAVDREKARSLLGGLSRSSLNLQLELGEVLPVATEASQQAIRNAIETTKRASLIASTAYGNPDFLTTYPSVEDDELEDDYFEVDGVFLGDEDGSWNIGGVVITNVHTTKSAPSPNENVRVEGIVRGDKVFISEVERHEDDDEDEDRVVIEGKFQGASSDGAVWRVGGLPVTRPQDSEDPPQGAQVQVSGTLQDDDFVGKVESREEEDEKGIDVKGTLSGTDPDRNTIALTVAGSKVVINLAETTVQDKNGDPLSLSDLADLQGASVKATGLNKNDGVLSAKRIRVNVEQKPTSADREPGGDRGSDKSTSGEDKKQSQDDEDEQGKSLPTSTPAPPEEEEDEQETRRPDATPGDTGTQESQRPQQAAPTPPPSPAPSVTPTREIESEWRRQPTPEPTPAPTATYRRDDESRRATPQPTATPGPREGDGDDRRSDDNNSEGGSRDD